VIVHSDLLFTLTGVSALAWSIRWRPPRAVREPSLRHGLEYRVCGGPRSGSMDGGSPVWKSRGRWLCGRDGGARDGHAREWPSKKGGPHVVGGGQVRDSSRLENPLALAAGCLFHAGRCSDRYYAAAEQRTLWDDRHGARLRVSRCWPRGRGLSGTARGPDGAGAGAPRQPTWSLPTGARRGNSPGRARGGF